MQIPHLSPKRHNLLPILLMQLIQFPHLPRYIHVLILVLDVAQLLPKSVEDGIAVAELYADAV